MKRSFSVFVNEKLLLLQQLASFCWNVVILLILVAYFVDKSKSFAFFV